MVGVTKVQRANALYWIEAVADGAEDYYTKPGEAPGEWLGEHAAELGLRGEVDRAAYAAVLEGRDPTDGSALVRRPPTRTFEDAAGRERTKEPVLAFDVRFAAPKSVSLVYALGDEDTRHKLIVAYDRAVAAGVRYLEQEACFVQRGRGGKRIERGQGFVAMAFRHRMSRAGDPALHTHVLVANMTRAESDGKWLSLAAPMGRSALYQHGKAAGHVFQAQLRAELTRELGVKWGPVRNGYADIAGISRAAIEHFSRRRAEILEAMAALGVSSARAAEVAAYRTREGKDYGVDPDRRREEWRARAQEFGLGRDEVSELCGSGREPRLQRYADLEAALRDLERTRSHFDRRDLLCALANRLGEGADLSSLTEAVDRAFASELVVSLGRPGDPSLPAHYTTPRIWGLEQKFLELAREGWDAGVARVEPRTLEQVLSKHSHLGQDQREMVKRLCAGGERVVPVAALPGAGKTTALAAAVEAFERQSHPVIGAATARAAAGELADLGIPSTSIAALLYRTSENRLIWGEPLARGTVLVIDEASTTSTPEMAQLAELAQGCEGKLVLVGDPRQIGAVGPGGLFGHLTREIEPSLLTEIRRQKHELDRRIVELAHAGRGSDALDLLRAEDRLRIADTIEEARAACVLDWHEAFSSGADAVMVARRNRDVQDLNASARALLHAEGGVGEEAVRVAGREFAVGDRVITRVNSAEVSNRERFGVIAVDPERAELELQRIGGDMCTVTLGPNYLNRTTPNGDPALQHAYGLTVYGSQGKTFDQAFCLIDPGQSREEFTVAVSRARDETLAYGVASVEFIDPELGPGTRRIEDELHDLRFAAERPDVDTIAAEAALRERIAAQEAAALRSRQAELERLQAEAQRRAPGLEELQERERWIAAQEQRLAELAAARAALEAKLFRPKAEQARVRGDEAFTADSLRYLYSERDRLAAEIERFEADRPHFGPTERLERELISERLEQLLRREVAAERLEPSLFVREALGERPTDARQLETWNQGVQEIHRYRQEHGITDPRRPFGVEPRDPSRRHQWELAHERLEQRQRELGRDRERTSERSLERRRAQTMERGLDRGLELDM
jgi:conjugative relaxase-like TrwC/TraI family protein